MTPSRKLCFSIIQVFRRGSYRIFNGSSLVILGLPIYHATPLILIIASGYSSRSAS